MPLGAWRMLKKMTEKKPADPVRPKSILTEIRISQHNFARDNWPQKPTKIEIHPMALSEVINAAGGGEIFRDFETMKPSTIFGLEIEQTLGTQRFVIS